ncbi:hypothetical protein FKM82_028127 [Ascaphus truei]
MVTPGIRLYCKLCGSAPVNSPPAVAGSRTHPHMQFLSGNEGAKQREETGRTYIVRRLWEQWSPVLSKVLPGVDASG